MRLRGHSKATLKSRRTTTNSATSLLLCHHRHTNCRSSASDTSGSCHRRSVPWRDRVIILTVINPNYGWAPMKRGRSLLERCYGCGCCGSRVKIPNGWWCVRTWRRNGMFLHLQSGNYDSFSIVISFFNQTLHANNTQAIKANDIYKIFCVFLHNFS